MARKRLVTRTIQTTTFTALGMDINTAEPGNKSTTLPGIYKDPAKALAAVKAALDTDTFKCVAIVDTVVNEDLWGMEESLFLTYAEKLPPRTAQDNTNDNEMEG